jgi:hypothetical protein
MRKLMVLFGVLTVCLALSCVTAQAQTTLDVSTVTSFGTASGANSVSYHNNNFDGWSIKLVAGSNNAPTAGPGLDITSLIVTCKVTTCDELTIALSGQGFMQAVGTGGFISTYNTTQTGSGIGSLQAAYEGATNSLFDLSTFVGSNGPFFGPGTFTDAVVGGVASPSLYSLTLYDYFVGTKGDTFVITDNSLGATPEPTSMLLMGSGLLALGAALRRKKAKIAASV